MLCYRVKRPGLLLGADERCYIAEPCCVAECYVPEAASEHISVLLLTSVASSCPPSVVLTAEDAGDSLLREEERG